MFSVKIIAGFSGAHRLRNYKGKCEELHGHNWKVEVSLFGSRLDDAGMLFDFTVLKKKVDELLQGLDHKYLNDLPAFQKVTPTSENIAKHIFENVSEKFSAEVPATGAKVSHITVWETETSAATYHAGAGGFLAREATS